MSASALNPLTLRLNESQLRRRLVEHDFFRHVKVAALGKEQAASFIGQWWHPLHYFPTFLARSISNLPDIESKCAIARILDQEVGGGSPKRAHEVLYVDDMVRAGFTKEQASQTAPYAETVALVAGYERCSLTRFSALGCIFATEVADLVMVSGIGTAVERVTGMRDSAWVKIHVQQEPDHVDEADNTMLRSFSPQDEAAIMGYAEEMWRLWIAFFDRLEKELFASSHASPPRQATLSA